MKPEQIKQAVKEYKEIYLKECGVDLSEEEATVEEVIEPYLIQLGFLERTARGRVATQKAYEHSDLKKKFDKR